MWTGQAKERYEGVIRIDPLAVRRNCKIVAEGP